MNLLAVYVNFRLLFLLHRSFYDKKQKLLSISTVLIFSNKLNWIKYVKYLNKTNKMHFDSVILSYS